MSLDSKAHQAIFTGNVVVKDPEFNVTCDKLTAI
jgi:lipopolysaccharide export system protein LptA